MGKMKDVIKMISGIAFLRPILKLCDCDCDKGIMLVVDSDRDARMLAKYFETRLNGKIVKRLRKMDIQDIQNFEAAFYITKGTENREALEEFLMEEEFFPVVFVGNKIPSGSWDDNYFLRINTKEFQDEIESEEEEFRKFRKYTIANPMQIKAVLLKLDTSKAMEEYRVEYEFLPIYKAMSAVGYVWRSFLWSTRNEKTAEIFLNRYLHTCRGIVDKFRDYESTFEIQEEVNELTWDYVGAHVEVKFANVEMVGPKANQAMKADCAILYDEDYYYIPEKLMKQICAPLLKCLSVSELKGQLEKERLILCNGEGFTVKKKFRTIDGVSGRCRAFKFVKEKLISPDGFRLEDLYADADEIGGDVDVYREK